MKPTSAQDLFNKLMGVAPTTGNMVRVCTDPAEFYDGKFIEGTFWVLGDLDSLTHFKWDEMLTTA